MRAVLLRSRFSSSVTRRRIFVEVLHAFFVNEKVRLRVARDADDILVVVFDPSANFLAIDKFHDDRCAVLGKTIDIFGLSESRFGRGLAAISSADVLIRDMCWHVRSIPFSMLRFKSEDASVTFRSRKGPHRFQLRNRRPGSAR